MAIRILDSFRISPEVCKDMRIRPAQEQAMMTVMEDLAVFTRMWNHSLFITWRSSFFVIDRARSRIQQ